MERLGFIQPWLDLCQSYLQTMFNVILVMQPVTVTEKLTMQSALGATLEIYSFKSLNCKALTLETPANAI